MLYSYFERKSKSKNIKLFVVLLFSTLISILIMHYFDLKIKTTESPLGIISFEFAEEIGKSIKIINTWKEKDVIDMACLSMGYDFIFAFFYITFISLSVFLVTDTKKNRMKIIGKTLVWAMLLVGFLEIIENISLIQLLVGNIKQSWATIAYYAAIPKLVFVFLTSLYVIVNALRLLFR